MDLVSPYLAALFLPLIPIFIITVWEIFACHRDLKSPEGCERVGIYGKGNLDDQYDERYSHESPNADWKVKALFVFPVKSCSPVELDQADVVETGLAFDRQYSFAQDLRKTSKKAAWEFITQRTFPKMSQIKTELWLPTPKSKSSNVYHDDGGCLIMRFPYRPSTRNGLDALRGVLKSLAAKFVQQSLTVEPMISVRLPVKPSDSRIQRKAYPRENMVIWKECPEALNMTSEIDSDTLRRLQSFIGTKHALGLFRIDPKNYRQVFRCAPKKEAAGYQPITGFADAYPIHLANLASVHDVGSRIPNNLFPKFDALRFRANIYVTGPFAFAEDQWRKISIGSGAFDVACRCVRCKLPNIDPDTGVPDRNHPLSTMTKYRKIDEGATFGPCFGMNLVPLITEDDSTTQMDEILRISSIKVGDSIKNVETGKHFYIQQ